ncbi:Sugar transferase [Pedobacter cryoconitis]|uniref:Sugar transferase n=1 Tax=Pedobacter cryoconitis TaxID=188932 RepID=A0A127VJ83_9SPHI|nr:glycosyltransferase [Pedobacter cryoconitis]AMQ01328.1 Sugar transferase [Pedobacter cryoconitis]
MQSFAPIALFVYNRPKHTERTLKFLRQNELAAESRLFVFSDGPKSEAEEENVREVRELLKHIDGFRSVEVIERKSNMGLAESVIAGVSRLVKDYKQVIVFEDDLVTSPYTLTYFNDALTRYRDQERVMHIGAYMYPLKENTLPETFFYRAATSWGWATWDRAWQHFEPNIDVLMRQFDARKRAEFSIEHQMNFWKQMKDFKRGKNNSWAIRWYASVFLRGGLTLNPSQSLVNNIGHDGSGVHSGINDIYNVIINPRRVRVFPEVVEESVVAYEVIKGFLSTRKGSFVDRLKRYLKGIGLLK